MTDDPRTPCKSPEPPDKDAVNEHRQEGEGPFGAGMTHLLGGTRAPESTSTPARGSAYSTGTETADGTSLSPADSRSRFDGRGKDGAEES